MYLYSPTVGVLAVLLPTIHAKSEADPERTRIELVESLLFLSEQYSNEGAAAGYIRSDHLFEVL